MCVMVTNTTHETIEPHVSADRGLTMAEAAKRREQYGLNMTPEERRHPLLALLGKLWAPVPWMLELTIILELLLEHYAEAEIIGVLLIVNATLSFVQEGRANMPWHSCANAWQSTYGCCVTATGNSAPPRIWCREMWFTCGWEI